ncbi:MAG TPA: TolC family protein, partial [Sulfurimonas autotrophica]|nr:TolC family protein [Sulfurimonas autotrophica]
NALKVQSAAQKSEITTRYKNPTLGLEASQFAQDGVSSNEGGYRVELTQPIRLWGVGEDRENLGKAQEQSAKKSVTLAKATFVRDLSLHYVAYKRLVHLQELAAEELVIAQKIAAISKARFENGTIARVKYLQAKMDMQRIKNSVNRLDIAKTDAYYNLLAFAGLTLQRDIEADYSFALKKSDETSKSPELEYLYASERVAAAKAELNANKLEWVDLRAEFENEPDQDIYRVGVNIPLVIFNAKRQEKQIAKLQSKQQTLLYEQKENANSFTLKKIEKLIERLTLVQQSTKELQASQLELLLMYEDGYKIANIDLIELQLIKNQMISTKEKLIDIDTQKEKNIIEYNYLTGAYNE